MIFLSAFSTTFHRLFKFVNPFPVFISLLAKIVRYVVKNVLHFKNGQLVSRAFMGSLSERPLDSWMCNFCFCFFIQFDLQKAIHLFVLLWLLQFFDFRCKLSLASIPFCVHVWNVSNACSFPGPSLLRVASSTFPATFVIFVSNPRSVK